MVVCFVSSTPVFVKSEMTRQRRSVGVCGHGEDNQPSPGS